MIVGVPAKPVPVKVSVLEFTRPVMVIDGAASYAYVQSPEQTAGDPSSVSWS